MRKIIITGGGGFLGQKLAKTLLASSAIEFEKLVLADIVEPKTPSDDPRVDCHTGDLTQTGEIEGLITSDTDLIFHLAAIVSSHAESDFDLGWTVNLDVTRQILERCRQLNPSIQLVFSSTLAAFGGDLPDTISHSTATTPQSSYGAQKASCELLINDYSRKGFIDGRCLRLPTVCVRPGKPNKAASSFVSSIIREPLNGETVVCPVDESLDLLITSPDVVINNLIHLATLPASELPLWRTINAPGITISVSEMLEALARVGGEQARQRVVFERSDSILRIVETWPTRIDNQQALSLGFSVDQDFDSILQQHHATIS